MPKQMLLADDSITIQKVIALTFAGEDFQITSVDNGADALVKAREIKPDIILADVVMPQKNGYDVCEAIKNDPGMKGIPVLLLAGTFEPFDEDQARKAGADGHIIKPFESQSLIRKVKELISAQATMPAAEAGPVTPLVPKAPDVTQPPIAPEVKPVAATSPRPPASSPPAPPVIPPAPPVVATAPAAEEDFWGSFMEEAEEEKAQAEDVAPESPATAAPEEEVWDIGEFEEPVVSEESLSAAEKAEEELWGTFAFEDTVEEVVEEGAPVEEEFTLAAEEAPLGEAPLPLQEAAEEEFVFDVEEMPELSVEEISEAALEDISAGVEEPLEILPEEPIQPESEEFAFLEDEAEAPSTPEVGMEPPSQFTAEQYEKTFEPEAFSREVSLAPPSPEPVSPPPASMPEEQLRAALSQVSREVIEKIVWEVVPDLAEILIKEEIKRLQKKQ